jgi:hypothetical protein
MLRSRRFSHIIDTSCRTANLYNKDNCIKAILNNQVAFLYDIAHYNCINHAFVMQHFVTFCMLQAYKHNKLDIILLFTSCKSQYVHFIDMEAYDFDIDKRCVQYYQYIKGLPFSKLILNNAIYYNNNETIQYYLERDKPLWPLTCEQATKLVKDENIECFELMLKDHIAPNYICIVACSSLKCLKFFMSKGYPVYSNTCFAAIRSNNCECLDHLINNGCQVGDKILFEYRCNAFLHSAIQNKRKDMFNYLITLNCTATSSLYRAVGNNLKFIDLLIDHGCNIPNEMFQQIIDKITLETFTYYILKFPCLNNEVTITTLIYHDKLDMLQHIYKSNTLTEKEYLC